MPDVTMPQLGETVTEGTITKWYKAVGDQVSRDEPLFEVSTDKVDSEVPSPAEGVLTAILVEEGDTVDVGVTLAVIGDESASNGTAPAPTATEVPRPGAPAPSRRPAPGRRPAPAAAATAAQPAPARSSRRRPPPPPSAITSPTQGLVLSPVVRKLLNEHGIDPSSVTGTGLGGRITRSDVDQAIAGRAASSHPDAAGAPAAVPSIAERHAGSTGGHLRRESELRRFLR